MTVVTLTFKNGYHSTVHFSVDEYGESYARMHGFNNFVQKVGIEKR